MPAAPATPVSTDPAEVDYALPSHYLRLIGDLLAGMGMDVPAWLARGGLDPAVFDSPHTPVTFEVFARLVRDGLSVIQEPAMGLLVGERLRANTHGMLGYAALSSSTLRQAMELMERFMQVRTTMVTARHEIRGDTMRVLIEPTRELGDLEVLVTEAVTLTIKNLVDQMSLGASPVACVAFRHPAPSYADLAQALFRCEVQFGQNWAGIAVPLSAVDQPLSMADPRSFEEAARLCQQELDQRQAQASWTSKVRHIMLETPGNFPSLQVAARLFHVSPRTLHRRLIDEGTSYQAILEDVRHRMAVQYLRAGHLSVQEVAYHLGYTDQANFRRAFKRWEGVAPTDFRTDRENATRKPEQG